MPWGGILICHADNEWGGARKRLIGDRKWSYCKTYPKMLVVELRAAHTILAGLWAHNSAAPRYCENCGR
jgi:hypothetical protein